MSIDLDLVLGACIEAAIIVPALIVLARLARRRAVVWLTVGSFVLRVTIGEALYVVSVLKLPLLIDLQLPDGFWKFGYDGWLSNNRANTVLEFVDDSRIAALRSVLTRD